MRAAGTARNSAVRTAASHLVLVHRSQGGRRGRHASVAALVGARGSAVQQRRVGGFRACARAHVDDAHQQPCPVDQRGQLRRCVLHTHAGHACRSMSAHSSEPARCTRMPDMRPAGGRQPAAALPAGVLCVQQRSCRARGRLGVRGRPCSRRAANPEPAAPAGAGAYGATSRAGESAARAADRVVRAQRRACPGAQVAALCHAQRARAAAGHGKEAAVRSGRRVAAAAAARARGA